jgi:hypothetical protein
MVSILLALFLYLPIWAWAVAVRLSEIAEGLNYFADTLLFGGTALLLAAAMPRDSSTQSPPSSSVPGAEVR